jgi:DNA polymerase-3 subunit beta
MRFRCKRADLAQAVGVVASVVPARTSIPILQNVKVTASEGELIVTATDMEMGLRYEVRDVGIQKSGAAALPAQKLNQILRDIRDDEVKFDVDGKLASIEIEGGQFKIAGADPQDFPEFPEFVEGRSVKVAVDDFRDMVRKTAFAVSQEPSRYALTGVLFVLRESEARMVGTDGKRLAYVKKRIKGGPKEEIRVIVPPKALHLVEKIVGEEDEEIAFEFEETQVKARTGAGRMFARLVEGAFPNYEDVIPADADKKVSIPAADFEYRLRLAAAMTDDKSRVVKFHISKDRMKLFARRVTGDAGEASHEVQVKYAGPEIDVSFNPDLFLDFLRVVNGASASEPAADFGERGEAKAAEVKARGKAKGKAIEEKPKGEESPAAATLTLELRDRNTAGVVRAVRDYIYLVMPLNLDE